MKALIVACILVLTLASIAPHIKMGVYHERSWAALWIRWR